MMDISTIKTLDVFSFEKLGKQTGLGLVLNGTPYMLWTHVYQNLEMTMQHAQYVMKNLKDGVHVISFTSGQISELKTRLKVTFSPGFNSSVFYFLTAEGFNRIVMDIDTFRMKDQKIANAIEDRNNQMAAVFTKYEAGTLALPAPRRHRTVRQMYPVGYVPIAPVFKDRKAVAKGLGFPEATANIMALQQTEEITGQNLQVYVQALPLLPTKVDEKRFSSSAIADRFGISKHKSNRFLADNFLVEQFGNDWILTDIGKKYGVMQPTLITSGSKTVVKYSPRWSPEVVAYLKKNNAEKGQKLLC